MAESESQTNDNPSHVDHHDMDDDDIETSSQHKIRTTVHKPEANDQDSAKDQIQTNFDALNLIKNNLKAYVNTTTPPGYEGFIHCHVKRDKGGITKGFTTTFSLYFDGPTQDEQTLLLVARKLLKIGGHAEYLIAPNLGIPIIDLSEENLIGKLRGIDITESEYVLYDYQNSSANDPHKPQSLAVFYDDPIFGSSQPRKLIVLLKDHQKAPYPIKEGTTIIDQWRHGHCEDLIEIKNKAPVYDEESKSYTIGLYGNRVKLPSHKNFQLINSNGKSVSDVIMQFGRIDDNTFALDYRYPLTALQAFAIALSSFHNRIRN